MIAPRTDTRRVTMSGPGRTCSTAWLYGFERDRNDESCFAASSPSWGTTALLHAKREDPEESEAGRVRDSLDGQLLTGLGQIFRVAMYHENHPDGSYQMANLVLAFEPPRVISWKPGYVSPETGKLEFGGWIWRNDLTQLGPDETKVTLFL